MNTIDYMAALKAAMNISSDYALAKRLGVAQQTTSRWSQGKGTIDDSLAPVIADVLKLNTAKVLADLHAEREKNDALRAVWLTISAQFAKAACIIAASAALNITLAPRAEASNFCPDNINSRTRKRMLTS